MARITIEDCLDKINSRFTLVHLARRRVLQLRQGANPLVEAPKNREVVLALREIAAGKVTLKNILDFERLEEQEVNDRIFKPTGKDLSAAVKQMVARHRGLTRKQSDDSEGVKVQENVYPSEQ